MNVLVSLLKNDELWTTQRQLEREYNVAVDISKGYGEHDPLKPAEEEINWAVPLIPSLNQTNREGAGKDIM